MKTRAALLLAAAPAVLASALVMRAVELDRVDITQQLGVALISAACAALTPSFRRDSDASPRWWPPVVLAACLFFPLADSQDWGPRRWLYFGGFGLYVAPIVLPVLLLSAGPWPAASLWVGGLALLLQPDAAQLTALAAASLPLLLASRHARLARLSTALALLAAVFVCWQRPDPLAPVDHVEGALRLAGAQGPLAITGALAAVLLPSAILSWMSFRLRSAGLLAAALYFAALVCLAPLEVTPVPFLGFGSAPIIGYALMAWTATRRTDRRRADPERPRSTATSGP